MDLQKYNVKEINLESSININGGTEPPYDRGYEAGHAWGKSFREALGTVGMFMALGALVIAAA